MTKPIVAIIGRQNVGKSTLLNRLAGRRIAIVEDLPGTTRDRVMADVSWHGADFTVVDTGGLEMKPETALARKVRAQAEVAIVDADVILFLTDVRDGVIPIDVEIANILRRAGKPVLLVINKVDEAGLEAQAAEFYQLGLGEPLPISAYHGRGVAELLNRILPLLPAPAPEVPETASEVIKLAIVGRPGVGKSTLLNALLGKERAIVGETPGTTRDATDTTIDFRGRNVLLIDTAGIRRRGKIVAGVERYSVIRALEAIARADVASLVLDASEPLTAEDLHIAGFIQQAAKGIVIVGNKWDLARGTSKSEYTNYIAGQFKFMPYASVLLVSAKAGEGVNKILPEVTRIYEERFKRLSTSVVNDVVQQSVAAHKPARKGGRQLKILYATQAGVNPPTFVFFVNDAKLVHFSYRRYLENKLRQIFGFMGTPIRLTFRTRGEA